MRKKRWECTKCVGSRCDMVRTYIHTYDASPLEALLFHRYTCALFIREKGGLKYGNRERVDNRTKYRKNSVSMLSRGRK